ncbi:DUF2750 domain-containing protein [Frigidibacter sp. SD6-1]|uniref:DUF2750 domain-containing protein n=1 Tax=Frigidibacter sp. SD6-1 TaxID=3032581 RepID=UPI0024DF6188|nr:DUF2750 domain-containing protein [Frigidibacter sp. SD6-1]
MRDLDELSEIEILEIRELVTRFEGTWVNSIEPSKNEIDAVTNLNNDQCAHYGLIRIAVTGRVFRASDDDGTIFHKYPNGDESIPFYPAEAWLYLDLQAEYPEARAIEMETKYFVDRYLKRMEKDQLYAEILALPQNKALLVMPSLAETILVAIQAEISAK